MVRRVCAAVCVRKGVRRSAKGSRSLTRPRAANCWAGSRLAALVPRPEDRLPWRSCRPFWPMARRFGPSCAASAFRWPSPRFLSINQATGAERPGMLKYTEDHEWLKQDGDEIIVGITAHASDQLGDVVFIELPEVGREVAEGEEIVVIESVKAASDIVAPVAGVITAVNEGLPDNPGAVNADPAGTWFFRIKPASVDLSGFMDEAAYQALIG